ncbi:hypothetical protein CVU37_08410 [candidate division BRC1 bacterium HGW-BRC1-1]|jgi:phosphoesterase RecJ-like protein|nr:MAG: hypothetical protein CVU37_08410 [candidate division BRC1 bacterium HGW-BRC1-1]
MSASVETPDVIAPEPSIVHEIIAQIRSVQRIIILGHSHPDGDCFGSGLSLYGILKAMGKDVRFVTTGPIPHYITWMPWIDDVETTLPPHDENPDLWIYVDCGDQERVDDDWRPTKGPIINIDHHLSNTRFGGLNWVDTDAAAAAEMIYRLALVIGVEITPDIATCIFTGLMTDTGGFRYSNTDSITFSAAGHMVKCGAKPSDIAQAVFESRKPQSVKLMGEVYATLNYEFSGHFVWNEITQDLYRQVGGDEFEPDGLSSDIRAIEGVEMSALFHETEEGHCRVGLRSRGKVNVSALAQMLGGGGHHNASGAYMRGECNYAVTRDAALETIRKYLSDIF